MNRNFFKQPNISVMKPNRLELKMKAWPVFSLLIALQLLAIETRAQLPDCSSGTVMYGVFNDVGGSGVNAPSEIRPINYITGAIGAPMGSTSYMIRKRRTSGDPYFYGSSGLGVDLVTNRFYLCTQMGSGYGMGKDVYTINTLTATLTRIGTTPASLDDYHFVKLAISPLPGLNPYGYMIGVHRSQSASGATFNPLVRFTTCGGTPSIGCSTIETLGYLPDLPKSSKWDLFNGDMAFDNVGNMYFMTSAFGDVGGTNKYTDARLFRINVADIPTVAGTGVIPMSLVAEYNMLDSTVLVGTAVDATGAFYFSTRRFNGPTNPSPPFTAELYKSTVMGVATIIPPYTQPAGLTPADLASCYFPMIVLDENTIDLSGKYAQGANRLSWKVNNNNKGIIRYEIQRSDDFSRNYVTIGSVDPVGTDQAIQTYTYNDPNQDFGSKKYYRIRQVFNDGKAIYSKVLLVNNTELIHFVNKPKPNPFINDISVAVELQKANPIMVKITDASGRVALQRTSTGVKGINNINIDNLGNFKPGIYFLEISAGSETIHDKIVKR